MIKFMVYKKCRFCQKFYPCLSIEKEGEKQGKTRGVFSKVLALTTNSIYIENEIPEGWGRGKRAYLSVGFKFFYCKEKWL